VALPVQRRARAALLVYLAIERDVSRAQVLSVFWPESSEDKARHALSQALYQLRQTVGEESLLVEGDRIRVLGALQIDAEEFEQAVEADSTDVALQLYRAPFLAGIDNLPTKSLENWADARRAHYERLHRRARRAQINNCLARADYDGAIAVAREWVKLDPQEDEAQHKLIELLAAGGQRTDAVRQYEVYERLLAVDDLEPLAETKTLITAIRTRGAGDSMRAPAGAPASQPDVNQPQATGPVPGSSSHSTPDALRRTSARSRVMLALALVVFAALIVIGWGVVNRKRPVEIALDADRILIMPFRAVGMDTIVASIGDGVVDLLSAKLGGTVGLRAIDPQTTFAALRRWQKPATELPRDSAVLFARSLGAGKLLSGSVVATLGRVTISADLIDVTHARVRSRASVEGDVDSLTVLLDRLITQVIGGQLGENVESLATFTSASPGAVQEYLRGRYAYRRSEFSVALAHFDRAIELDSLFALAALYFVRARGYDRIGPNEKEERARRLACAARNRVGPAERLRLIAFAECPDVVHDIREVMDFTERAAALAPGDAELWGLLGDGLFHGGRGLTNWRQRAMSAFQRALDADVDYAPEALAHLIVLKAEAGDTAAVRRLSKQLVNQDTAGFWGVDAIWLPAALSGDTATLERLRRSRFAELLRTRGNLYSLSNYAQNLGLRIQDAELAVEITKQQADSTGSSYRIYMALAMAATLNLNGGRAAGRSDKLAYQGVARSELASVAAVVRALFWEGDQATAEAALPELTRFVGAPPSEDRTTEDIMKPLAHCALGLWFFAHNDTLQAKPHISFVPATTAQTHTGVCRETLSTLLAFAHNAADRIAQLETLDSLLLLYPSENASSQSQLIAAQLFERSGQPKRALAAVRRTYYESANLLSSFLREEGRLAALTGDTTGAIRAYRHFLTLRHNPDPQRKGETERIRSVLAGLEGKQRR
jgi:DNA-binding SARP family transcriptional activator/TolB-like protein